MSSTLYSYFEPNLVKVNKIYLKYIWFFHKLSIHKITTLHWTKCKCCFLHYSRDSSPRDLYIMTLWKTVKPVHIFCCQIQISNHTIFLLHTWLIFLLIWMCVNTRLVPLRSHISLQQVCWLPINKALQSLFWVSS